MDIPVVSIILAIVSGLVAFFFFSVLLRLLFERLNKRKVRKVMKNYAPDFVDRLNFEEEPQPQSFATPKGRKTRQKASPKATLTSASNGFMAYFARQIEKGGLKYRTEIWIAIQGGGFLVTFLLVLLLNNNFLIAVTAGLVLVLVVPNLFVAAKFNKRLISFETELPETLMLVASALRSGLSFQQALEATVSERDTELGLQMRQAINESRLGPPLEESLDRVADRMRSEDLRWLVAAIEIQREVGGTLSTILDTAATTIKGREELRREVRSLSAEGRLSAYVLVGLPAGIFFFLFISRPEYISFFWTDFLGVVMLIMVLVMMGLGWLWMNKMIRIKV